MLKLVKLEEKLNEQLIIGDGHIGAGIRPSERCKGFGIKMVALAVEKCDKLGIKEVLVCCNKDNIASAKTIINNGGILENEII